jgi:hypothetical protein
MRSFEEQRSMIARLAEVTLVNVVALGFVIYDGSRLWTSIVAVWALVIAFLFGFSLGNLPPPEGR